MRTNSCSGRNLARRKLGGLTSPFRSPPVFSGYSRGNPGPPPRAVSVPATASIASRSDSASSRRRFIRHNSRLSGSTASDRLSCALLMA